MKLDAFSGKDLNNMKVILHMAKRYDITDVEDLLNVIENKTGSLEKVVLSSKQNKKSNKQNITNSKVCPKCNSKAWKLSCNGDMYCKNCRYSEMG